MQLEELEVVFKANYGDLVSKTQQIYQLIESKTNSLANNIQNDLNRANQATQSGVQSSNQAAEATARAEEKKQQAYQKTSEAKKRETVEIQTWTDNEIKAMNQASEAANKFQEATKKVTLSGDFDPAALQEAYKQYKAASDRIWQDKAPKIVKQADPGIDDLIKSQGTSAKQDVSNLYDTVNERMTQAKQEQAKLVQLMRSRTSAQASGDPLQLQRIDAQIDQSRIKMTRYQNQAKSLAQAMRTEFGDIPNTLKRIANAMDENEIAIEAQRRKVSELKQAYIEAESAGRDSSDIKAEYNKQDSILDKLIAHQDDLEKSYEYTQDRGEALKNIVDKLNTSLEETDALSKRASRSGGGGGFFSNLKQRLSGISNALSGARSRLNLFGMSALSAGRKASSGFRSSSSSASGLSRTIRMLASQIIVFELISQAIMNMAGAFVSALKTNSQFASSLNQIKVNLLTAFYPIYQTALPAINALMSALAKATGYIASFVSALTGTSLSANRAGAKGLYEQVQALNDTSKASNSANNALKKQQQEQANAVREANRKIQQANKEGRAAVEKENEKIVESNARAKKAWEAQKKASEDMKNSLMGFDEINVLDKDSSKDDSTFTPQPKKKFTPQDTQEVPTFSNLDSGSGTGSGSGGKQGLNWNIPINENSGAFKAAKDFKKLMGELFDPLKEAWASKGQSVIEAAKRAWAELSRAVGDVGHSFKTVWTNGTGEKVAESLLKLFRTLLNIIGDVGRAFAQAWEDHGRGTSTVQAIFNALNKVLVLLNDIGTSFRKAFNSGVGESIFAHLINYAHNLADQVGALAGQFDKAWKAGGTGESIWRTLLGMVDDYASYIDKASASWAKFDSHLNFGPILKSFDTLLKSIRSLGKDAFGGMYWGLTNVLQPLSKWTIEKAAPAAINALAAALKLVHTVLKAAEPAFKWAWDSFLKPLAQWTGKIVIAALDLLTKALTKLSDWASKNQKLIENVAKVLIGWFAFKVSTSAIETATSKFGSMLGVVKEVWTKKGVFKTLLSAFTNFSGLGKLKEIGENISLISSYAKDVAKISWTKISSSLATFGGKLKSIWTVVADLAKVSWTKIVSGFSSVYDIIAGFAKLAWTKLITGLSAVGSFLGTLAELAWAKMVSGLSALSGAFKALWAVLAANPVVLIVAAVVALAAGFAALYTHNKKFREWCNGIWGSISSTFGGIGKWFAKKWGDISKSWGDFKESFGKAWSDGWNGIKAGVTGKDGVWTKIKSGASDMWGNISGSWGIFKTNFKTSWDNHWGSVKSKVGDKGSGIFHDIISGAGSMFSGTKSHMSSWWPDFSNNWNTHWGSIKSKVGDKGSGIFHDIISGAGSMFGGIKSHMSSWWPGFSNNWGSHWGSVKSKVGDKNSGIFHDVISGAGSMFSGIKSHMSSWWPDFSKTWGSHWGSAKGTVTDAFDTLVTKAGKLGGRISDAVKGGWKAITKTFGELANKIISPIQSVIKKIGQGINWALKKVGQRGFDWTFDWTFKYANGTGGHPGGLALVNDQEGPTYQEAYQLPNGKTGLFPAVRNLLLDMPPGTKVMPAGQVKQIMDSVPHYAGGIGSFDWGGWLKDFESTMSKIGGSITTTVSNVSSAVGDAFEDILSDITHPSKLINFLINKFVGSNDQKSSIGKRFFAGGVNTMKNNMENWAKNFLKKFGDADPPGAGVARWRPVVIRALKANGLSTDNGIVNRVLTQMSWESGGNPHARQPGNDPDGDGSGPALGLMQTKRATFAANAFPGHGDLWNGYDNLLAAIHYAKAKYGPSLSFLGTGSRHGYENGGLIDREGYYLAGEGNKPEMVLPLTNRARSLELIQQAMQFMGANFSNGLRMPSAFTQPSFNAQAPQVASQGVNSDLGATIVNAVMQGLQMAQIGSGKQGSQPINVTIQVDSTKLGEVAVKSINQYNQANGRNMLRI